MEVELVTGMRATLLLFLAGIAANAQAPSPLPLLDASSHQVAARYGKLPLSFEPNQGQTDAEVQFVSRGASYTIFLSPASATFALQRDATAASQLPSSAQLTVVRMDLLGATPDIAMQPYDKLPGIANYLMGSTRAAWPTNLPTYAKTRSRNIYPGIDLVYYGTQGQLEYDFVLAPHADPAQIRLKFAGATPVVDASGDLVLSLGGKQGQDDIRFHKPVLYQQVQGVRQPVSGKFTIAANKNEISFQVSSYDHSRELVIDPVLVYSSYLGGSSQQSAIKGMAVNAAGEIYVTGITNALDYRTTPGVIQPTCPAPMTGGSKCGPSSSSAAFVSKISADGQSLIYSTYLGGGGPGPGVGGSTVSQGGSGSDFGTGIAVDANDNAWVVGETNSNNFPVTPDAYSLYCEPVTVAFDFGTLQNTGEISGCARFNGGSEYIYSGTYSLFLVKLNPTGTSILYGTFLGGTQGELQGQIALDATGNIYVSGAAYTGAVGAPAATSNYVYPTTASAYQPIPQANAYSAFVTELSPDGHTLLYSSFLSSTVGQTLAGGFAIGAGKIFVGGYTQSPTLPTTPGALSNTCPGSATQCPNNGFVAEFDPTKSGAASLVFSTYLNGKHVSSSGIARANSTVSALAADAAGNVYAGGSNQYKDFPTTRGVLQPTCNSSSNDSCSTGFVTKLSPAGALVWSTFYGSPSASGQYGVSAIALDAKNNVYIAGQADGAGDLPLSNGLQNYTSGVAYLTELSSDASKVLFGTFFGSGANIFPTGMVVDAAGSIYFAGYTAGALPLVNAFQSTNGGGFNEGFFAKIVSPTPVVGAVTNGASFAAGSITPGEIATLFGTNLTSASAINLSPSLPLPTSFLGVSVKVNGTAAPLFAVDNVNGQQQINFQVPWEAGNQATANIEVENEGTTSQSITVPVVAAQPGIFNYSSGGKTFGAILHANFQLADTSHPAAVGETVLIYCNGLGAVHSPPPDGTAANGQLTVATPVVSIAGVPAKVSFSGLAPGFAGLNQINAIVPSGVPAGNQPVIVKINSAASPAVLLPVK
jgi:uncharacterized protein (TIGR03437 family)